MRVGIGANHGGFEMKEQVTRKLIAEKYELIDFGNKVFEVDDDYPDFAIPLARTVASGVVNTGIPLCGSGVGAYVAAKQSDRQGCCAVPRQDIRRARKRRAVICISSAFRRPDRRNCRS